MFSCIRECCWYTNALVYPVREVEDPLMKEEGETPSSLNNAKPVVEDRTVFADGESSIQEASVDR